MTHRRFPHLQMLGEIQGQLIPLDIPLTVLDMSADGFAVESPIEFTPNAEYQFQFSWDNPQSVVRAVDVHCLRVVTDGQPWYIAGFYYAPTDSAERERILRMARGPEMAGVAAGPASYRSSPSRLSNIQ